MATPLVLLILDGWGHREESEHNAIRLARTPVLDALYRRAPHCLLAASGTAVGLPDGRMGNSEVGHLTIGSGRVIEQSLKRIDQAIAGGHFANLPVFAQAIDRAQESGGVVHILGLLSPGGVHSHQNHIFAAIELAAQRGAQRIAVHAFLDGRDTPPRSALPSLTELQRHCQFHSQQGCDARIASICGRFYAMDRDRRWQRTASAWRLLAQAQADTLADDAIAALDAAYARGESDEFVPPTRIGPAIPIGADDAVLFMNFRADRARQLSRALLLPDFTEFDRGSWAIAQSQRFVTLLPYADDIPAAYAFADQPVPNTLGHWLATHERRQLRIAESEKYAHVSYFFNGGVENPNAGEERILIPSPRVDTYDLQPEMSAGQLTDRLCEEILGGGWDFIVCNYANGDMVGHTGLLAAAVTAVETVDSCVGQVLQAVESAGGECLISADHGNCEQMHDTGNNQAHTAHTCTPVPFIYAGPRQLQAASDGGLADIAPTVLWLMGLSKPPEMSGNTLLSSRG